VGKTSLVYHLAWMFSDLRVKVLAVDLDPQANLTAAFFDEDTLESLWQARRPRAHDLPAPFNSPSSGEQVTLRTRSR